jgi:hypothetical protein
MTAFKELDTIPQFKATAKLAEFLEAGLPPAFYEKCSVTV